MDINNLNEELNTVVPESDNINKVVEQGPENKLKSMDELKDEARDYVTSQYEKLSDRGGYIDLLNKWEKLYNNISYKKNADSMANLFSPETRKSERTIENFIDEILFGVKPNFVITCPRGESAKAKTEVLTKTIVWQQENIKFRDKIRRFVRKGLIHGTAIAKVVWSEVKQNFYTYDEITKQQVEREVTTYNNIEFEVKDIRNIFLDPFVEDYKDLDIIIERKVVTKDYLLKKGKEGIYNDLSFLDQDYMNGKDGKTVDTYSKDDGRQSVLNILTGLTGNYSSNKNQYELLEAWFRFDINQDGVDEECLMVVIDKKYCIKFERNPFRLQQKPYLIYAWEKIDGSCLGQGIPQLAEKMQLALNDFLNQVMDNLTFIINNMWEVSRDGNILDQELKSRPRGVIHVDGDVGKSLAPLRPPNITDAGMQGIILTKDELRTGVETPNSLQGVPAKYGTTAAESTNQYNAAARGVFYQLRQLEDNIIVEFLKMAFHYDMQFMSREQFIMIVGKQAATAAIGNDLTLNSLYDEFTFVPLALSQMENRIVSIQQKLNMLNISTKLPQGIVNLHKLVAGIWQDMGNDISDGVVYPDPQAQLISPEDENLLLSQGDTITPHPMDNHILHIAEHRKINQALPNVQHHFALHMQLFQMMQPKQNVEAALPPQEQAIVAPGQVTTNEIEKVEPTY